MLKRFCTFFKKLSSYEWRRFEGCSFFKKRLQHRCFPVKFTKILRTPIFTESHRWLLLKISFWISSCTINWKLLNSKLLQVCSKRIFLFFDLIQLISHFTCFIVVSFYCYSFCFCLNSFLFNFYTITVKNKDSDIMCNLCFLFFRALISQGR